MSRLGPLYYALVFFMVLAYLSLPLGKVSCSGLGTDPQANDPEQQPWHVHPTSLADVGQLQYSRSLHKRHSISEPEANGDSRNMSDFVRTATEPPRNRSLPLFVFVAGVEGSGHHALGIALERCFDVSFSFAPEVWVAQYYSFTPYVWTRASDFYERLAANSYGASVIGARAVLDYQHSFPFGWFRSTLFHPDLNILRELDGEYLDLRVIFLHRDPTDTVISALKRGFVDDPFLQARIVEAALMYMDRFIDKMAPEKVAVIHYNRYRERPLEYLETLSRVAGYCNKEDLRDFIVEAELIIDRFRKQRLEGNEPKQCPRSNRRRPEDCDDFEKRIRAWFAARSKYWPRLAEERLW